MNHELFHKFLKALSYVCVPAAILRYYVEKMYKCQNLNDIKKINENVMNNILNSSYDSKKIDFMQGNMYKKAEKFKREFSKLGEYLSLEF